MIATQIAKLLAGGHSPDELLALLVKNAPKLKKEIGTLIGSGWGAKEVLDRVSKNPAAKGADFRRFQPLSPEETAANYIQRGEAEREASPQARGLETAKGIAKTAGAAALGYAGASLLPMALARAAPALGAAAQGAAPAAAQAVAPTVGAAAAQAAPAAIGAVANAIRKPTSTDPKEVLTALGIFDKIDAAKGQGKSPDLLALASNKLLSPEAKEIAKANDINVPAAVWEYLTGRPGPGPEEQASATPTIQPEAPAAAEVPPIQAVAPPEAAPENPATNVPAVKEPSEPAKPQPGKEAILPDGNVGEIESVDPSGRYVTVNVNGTRRRVKFEDVEVEPENVVAFVNQVAAIPESERSRLISFFAYQPETKTLAVQFHNGDFYTYDDIAEDKFKNVVNASGTAKTTGADDYGEHVAGVPDSRGAALIEEIINDPKYKKAKKGEPENTNYKRFGTLYDYWEKLRKKPKGKKAVTKP